MINKFFVSMFYICILFIEYLATTSRHIDMVASIWDKANHFVAFFVLYILLSFAYVNLSLKSRVVILLAFGIQIELVQYFLPARFFSFLDVFADAIGVMIGILFVYFINKTSLARYYRTDK